MKINAFIMSLASAGFALSCGAAGPLLKKSPTQTSDEGASSSADSSNGRVVLKGSSTFQLLNDAGSVPPATPAPSSPPAGAAEIVVSDSITVKTAKLSIALIKLKETKEPTPEEKQAENKQDAAESRADEGKGASTTLTSLTKDLLLNEAESKKTPKLTPSERQSLATTISDFINAMVALDDSIRFKGPFVFNAVTGKLEGNSAEADIKAGSYKRIQFKLKRNLDVEPGDSLEGNALVIEGTYKKQDGTTLAFDVEVDRTMKICLLSDTGFEVKSGAENVLGLFFDVKKWFDGVDLEASDVDALSDEIHISRRENKRIFRMITRNIQKHSGFFKSSGTPPKPDDIVGTGDNTSEDQMSSAPN